jgi:predicted RND superfamily exporter protein
MLDRIARLPLERPREIVAATIVITLLLAPFLQDVSFSTDVEAFLPDSPTVANHERTETLFGQESKVAQLYLVPSSGRNNVLTMPALLEMLDLHERVEQIPGVTNVVSVAGFFDQVLADGGRSFDAVSQDACPWEQVRNSMGPFEGGNYSIYYVDFVTDVLVHRDLDWTNFWYPEEGACRPGPNATAALVQAYMEPGLDNDQKKQVGIELRKLSVEWNDYATELEAEPFSVDLLAHDVDESTRLTNLMMGVGMLVMTVLLLWFSFRHWSYVLLPLLTLALAVAWTFAFTGLVGIQLTAIDVAVMPLVVGLGIDFAVHLSRRYQEELHLGRSVSGAMEMSLQHTGRALTLAMLTTVIAFLSGVTAGVGPVRDFSLICAFGIAAAFLLTVFFYSSLRFWLDSRSATPAALHDTPKMVETTIARAAMAVEQRPLTILAVVAVITLVALAGATRLDTSFSIEDFLSDDLPIMDTASSIRTDFRGASYAQSQILFEGNLTYREFLDDLSRLQSGLGDDTYIIQVGAEPRADSIQTLVQTSLNAECLQQMTREQREVCEPYSVSTGEDETYEWQVTVPFSVQDREVMQISWTTERPGSPALSTLEVNVTWLNDSGLQSDSNSYQADTWDGLLASDTFTFTVDVPETAAQAYLRFAHVNDADDDLLIESIAVRSDNYLFVQSPLYSFNLTHEAVSFSQTSDGDIRELFDYLWQRDLDVADVFLGTTYAEQARQLLHRDSAGEYDAAVVRIFVGPTHDNELDNEGLEQLLVQLHEDVPDDGFPDAEVSFTGGHILTITTVNAIQNTQLASTLVAIFLAAVLLVGIYRHVGLGLLNILPVILAAIWIMGTMAALGITLNVMTVMVTALTVGLGIDYAIHIVERYREESQYRSEQAALENTIHQTGAALLISGLTTIAGFGVLLLSPMPLVRNFGIITAATIVYSVVIAILVLPSLIWAGNRLSEWASQQWSG